MECSFGHSSSRAGERIVLSKDIIIWSKLMYTLYQHNLVSTNSALWTVKNHKRSELRRVQRDIGKGCSDHLPPASTEVQMLNQKVSKLVPTTERVEMLDTEIGDNGGDDTTALSFIIGESASLDSFKAIVL
nr:hypothetical protein Itr_chr01CG01170 [Ipomoea trifida]